MKIVILGVIIAIFGFAFAFSLSQPEYLAAYYLSLSQKILLGYPNLLSGFVIGIGGIVISIIGEIYRRENK